MGGSERRPYRFSFCIVLLWVNGAKGFCPSAPLGVLLSIVTKVPKKTFVLRERADPKQLCFAELVSGPTSSFAAIKALLNPTKETVWVITFPYFVCDTLQFAPYSLEKIDSLSFCTKPRLEKQLLCVFTM